MTSMVPVRSSTLVKAIMVLDLVVIIRFLTMVQTMRTWELSSYMSILAGQLP